MHAHTVNYRADENPPPRWRPFDRGFWIRGIPRPLLACRTFGHKPVVDGTGEVGEPGGAARWGSQTPLRILPGCPRCGASVEDVTAEDLDAALKLRSAGLL